MTTEQLQELLNNIVTDINIAADYVGIVDPALIPIITIGKAVDKMIPGLVGTVANMIQGTPPTQADLDEKARELAVLGDKGGI